MKDGKLENHVQSIRLLKSKWKIHPIQGKGEPTTSQKREVHRAAKEASGFVCSRIQSQNDSSMQLGNYTVMLCSTAGMTG